MENWTKWLIGIVSSVVLSLFTFYFGFVDFVDQHEVGYKFDARTGELSLLKEKGYIVTPPFVVKVNTIDLRPFQVCINANSRVLNCKLVQFDPEGVLDFVSWHGRDNYSAFSMGQLSTQGDLYQIMMSYAYESYGKDRNTNYKFLKVIKEIGGDDISNNSPDAYKTSTDTSYTK